MEMATQSFSYAKSRSVSPFIPSKSTVSSHKSVEFVGYNCLPRNLKCSAKQFRNFGAINASESDTSPTDSSVRWLLQPIGYENLFWVQGGLEAAEEELMTFNLDAYFSALDLEREGPQTIQFYICRLIYSFILNLYQINRT